MAKKLKKSSNTRYPILILNTTTSTRLFPHINRKINAGFKIFAILIILSFLLFNFLTLKTPLDNLKSLLLEKVADSKVHLIFADLFLKNNQLDQAKKELLFTLQFSPNEQSILRKLDEVEKIERQPEEIRKEIQKWEKIILEKPNYRDGYFKLAVLNYQIYQDIEAKKYLSKVLELDPNFEPAKKLSQQIK